MNKKVLHTLEFHKIILALTEFAASLPGKEACQALLPVSDPVLIARAQTETEDALSRIFKKSAPSFAGNQDLTFLVRSLEVGASLSSGELLKIATLLECSARICAYGRAQRDDEAPDSLTERFSLLVPLTQLAAEIRRCMPEEDVFADDASPALRRIRKSQATINDRIHSRLNEMVNGS